MKKLITSLLGPERTLNLVQSVLRAKVHGRRWVTRRPLYASAFPLRIFSEKEGQVFFGYYDLTPFSADEQFLLAMHAPTSNRARIVGTEISVGFYDLYLEKPVFQEVGKTSTWCWQQGCRLQWVPGKRAILYNRLVDGHYGTVIQDIDSKNILKSFKRALYAISPDGLWALSLNFSRLQRLRPGYGYSNLPDLTEDQSAPENDGVWRINLKTGEEKLLFSTEDIANFKVLQNLKNAEHYFNHLEWSPTGDRFSFFHLWIQEKKRYSRLILCGKDSEDMRVLIGEGHVSHIGWKNEEELLAYSTHADTGRNFHNYHLSTGTREVVGQGVLIQDGHPSFFPDGETLLTDTYPDSWREQHLIRYHLPSKTFEKLGTFFSPFNFQGVVRCDLHPRISPSGRFVCIDSPHTGRRALVVMDLQFKQ